MTDAGQIFITSLVNADDNDVVALELLNQPNEVLTVNVGENEFVRYRPSLLLPETGDVEAQVDEICGLLKRKSVIVEYYI